MKDIDIIEAAFRVWGRDFYRKTSLSQLAKELGVSKPALYRHFESKQALITAMFERFYDAFAASIRPDFEQALNTEDVDEGIRLIINSICAYFAKNRYDLIFSLVNMYDRNIDRRTMSEQLKKRGVDFLIINQIIDRKYKVPVEVLQLMFASLTFFMAHFHKTNNFQMQNIISTIFDFIKNGLKLNKARETALPENPEKLESMVDGMDAVGDLLSEEPEPLFKAVAEAVAEAGPWDASMEMVAKRMGLSKSSLYAHFKDRKDMLRRLFITEINRIIDFAKKGMMLSENPAEQLYLGIYSAALYFRSRPQILIAIGWIRTRRLDLGGPDQEAEIFGLFNDIKIEALQDASNEYKQGISHLIIFLLINVLTRPYLTGKQEKFSFANMQNNSIHILFKFITLGLGGFVK